VRQLADTADSGAQFTPSLSLFASFMERILRDKKTYHLRGGAQGQRRLEMIRGRLFGVIFSWNHFQ
jgi:hypothetical protein